MKLIFLVRMYKFQRKPDFVARDDVPERGSRSVEYRLRITVYTVRKNAVVVTYWYLVPGTLDCNYVVTLQKLCLYIIPGIMLCTWHE